jgi:hypothetical protein
VIPIMNVNTNRRFIGLTRSRPENPVIKGGIFRPIRVAF